MTDQPEGAAFFAPVEPEFVFDPNLAYLRYEGPNHFYRLQGADPAEFILFPAGEWVGVAPAIAEGLLAGYPIAKHFTRKED